MSLSLRSLMLALAFVGSALPLMAVPLPFVEDFELTDGGFTTTSPNAWKWGPPVSPEGPGAARSGTEVWGTNLNGKYGNNLNAVLVSPDYDLSAAAGKHLILHWWQFLITEEGFDYADVQVSKDGGGTWETVLGPRHGVVDSEWTQHTVLLDPSFATSAFKVRFRLVTDDSEAEGGFFIDDIRISTATFAPVVPLEDFEQDEGGYEEDGVNSSWEYGMPVSAPGGAFSGSNAWATHLNGFYNANEDSTLTSPVLNLSAAAGNLIAVAWRQFFDTEEGYDFLDLEVSNDGGATWQTALIQSGEVSAGGWSRMQAFLPASYATANFRLRFRFESDEAFQYDGVAIDDIAVLAATDVFPTAASFIKSAPENYTIAFTRDNFTSGYIDPDGGELDAIRILQLPAAGVLKLDDVAVTLEQVIATADLDVLTYEPPSNTTGSWSFTYDAANFFAPSATATVTLNILGPTPLVVIAEHPQPVTVNPGAQVVLSVTAISSLPLSYQWRLDGDDLDDEEGPSLTINTITEAKQGVYDVIVSNGGDTKTSLGALVSVNDPVEIEDEPTSTFVNEGGSITLSVTATGTGRIDYQWFRNGQILLNETFASLQITNAKEEDTGTYQCQVTNIVGSKPTSLATLTVRLAPRITSSPVPWGISRFRPALFKVVVAGDGPFTYQWFHNGFEIPGANAPTLTIQKPSDANLGKYHVRVSNGWASVESDPVELQVFYWRDVGGLYQDVLEAESSQPGRSPVPGRLSLRIGIYRVVSGVLQFENGVHRFRGRFDMSMDYEKVFRRSGKPPVRMRLRFDALSQTVSAEVVEETPNDFFSSTALLPRHSYARRVAPAPQTNRYTILLTPDDSVSGAPSAPAYLVGRVNPNGVGRFAGRLPNGRRVTSSGFLQNTQRLPWFSRLGRRGQFGGRLEFVPESDHFWVRGDLVWRHLPRSGIALLPDAFVASLEASGSWYKRPPDLQQVLTLPLNAELFDLEIAGGANNILLQRWVRLSPRNFFRILPNTEGAIRLKLNPRNGFVRGSFFEQLSGKRRSMFGVVNQRLQSMGGYFREEAEPGTFGMSPLLQ